MILLTYLVQVGQFPLHRVILLFGKDSEQCGVFIIEIPIASVLSKKVSNES